MLAKIQKRLKWVYGYSANYSFNEIEDYIINTASVSFNSSDKILKQLIFSRTGKETFLILDKKSIKFNNEEKKDLNLYKVFYENDLFWINQDYCDVL